MEVTKISFDMEHPLVKVKPLSEDARNTFRQKASEIATRVLKDKENSALFCDETIDMYDDSPATPKVRKLVSTHELGQLRRAAGYHQDLYSFLSSVESLISIVAEKIDVTDFSNGYDEETRNVAEIKEMEALFRTFLTIQQVYDQKCGYLEDDRRPFEVKQALKAWFEAAMGNLSLRLLNEVAQNNQLSRQGQLASLEFGTPIYNYVLERIGALDQEGNPDGWAEAALFDLEKFFTFPDPFELARYSPRELQVIDILHKSLNILRHYSH